MSGDLQQTIINLNANKQGIINESWLSMFGGAIEMLLKSMFKGDTGPFQSKFAIKGTPNQVAAFGDALGKEKVYGNFLKARVE